MKKLKELLTGCKVIKIIGDTEREINKVCFDSREATSGDLFVAIAGTQNDGHKYIEAVITQDVVAIVCENLPETLSPKVTFIQVPDSHEALGHIATEFYDHPSKQLQLVGVTGTNGKTTIASLLYMLHRKLGYSVGLLSTVENKIDDIIIPSTHTTPDALNINKLLQQMVSSGCHYCFMEVSSHAIVQHRITGLHFVGGIFTNLTLDHLDYHGDFAHYLKAKKQFFDKLPKTAFALTNKDDKNGMVMMQNTNAHISTYGLSSLTDFKGRILECAFGRMLLRINNDELWVRLTGKFNAYNITAIYGAALCLGHKKEEVLSLISALQPVSGRFETIISDTGIYAVVDYAHTPDALENVLNTINLIRLQNEQLITVVGCGGERDKNKRPLMAAIACRLSDRVILTSDNPRSEDPEQILNEMEQGLTFQDNIKKLRITNRYEAIRTAVMLAQKNDIILIAGKGHENYQEINGIRNYFNDTNEVVNLFKEQQK